MNKKIKLIILIILGVCMLYISAQIFTGKEKKEDKSAEVEENKIINEYTPLEEITEEQARQTVISLFYKNKNTGELIPEARRVDSKNLLENPYKYLVELLISDPDNKELESCIPEGTNVISASLKGNIVELNLSKEFIENHKGTLEEEKRTINSIVNTLTELNEVGYVRILIEGKENNEFKDKEVNFKENFCKE